MIRRNPEVTVTEVSTMSTYSGNRTTAISRALVKPLSVTHQRINSVCDFNPSQNHKPIEEFITSISYIAKTMSKCERKRNKSLTKYTTQVSKKFLSEKVCLTELEEYGFNYMMQDAYLGMRMAEVLTEASDKLISSIKKTISIINSEQKAFVKDYNKATQEFKKCTYQLQVFEKKVAKQRKKKENAVKKYISKSDSRKLLEVLNRHVNKLTEMETLYNEKLKYGEEKNKELKEIMKIKKDEWCRRMRGVFKAPLEGVKEHIKKQISAERPHTGSLSIEKFSSQLGKLSDKDFFELKLEDYLKKFPVFKGDEKVTWFLHPPKSVILEQQISTDVVKSNMVSSRSGNMKEFQSDRVAQRGSTQQKRSRSFSDEHGINISKERYPVPTGHIKSDGTEIAKDINRFTSQQHMKATYALFTVGRPAEDSKQSTEAHDKKDTMKGVHEKENCNDKSVSLDRNKNIPTVLYGEKGPVAFVRRLFTGIYMRSINNKHQKSEKHLTLSEIRNSKKDKKDTTKMKITKKDSSEVTTNKRCSGESRHGTREAVMKDKKKNNMQSINSKSTPPVEFAGHPYRRKSPTSEAVQIRTEPPVKLLRETGSSSFKKESLVETVNSQSISVVLTENRQPIPAGADCISDKSSTRSEIPVSSEADVCDNPGSSQKSCKLSEAAYCSNTKSGVTISSAPSKMAFNKIKLKHQKHDVEKPSSSSETEKHFHARSSIRNRSICKQSSKRNRFITGDDIEESGYQCNRTAADKHEYRTLNTGKQTDVLKNNETNETTEHTRYTSPVNLPHGKTPAGLWSGNRKNSFFDTNTIPSKDEASSVKRTHFTTSVKNQGSSASPKPGSNGMDSSNKSPNKQTSEIASINRKDDVNPLLKENIELVDSYTETSLYQNTAICANKYDIPIDMKLVERKHNLYSSTFNTQEQRYPRHKGSDTERMIDHYPSQEADKTPQPHHGYSQPEKYSIGKPPHSNNVPCNKMRRPSTCSAQSDSTNNVYPKELYTIPVRGNPTQGNQTVIGRRSENQDCALFYKNKTREEPSTVLTEINKIPGTTTRLDEPDNVVNKTQAMSKKKHPNYTGRESPQLAKISEPEQVVEDSIQNSESVVDLYHDDDADRTEESECFEESEVVREMKRQITVPGFYSVRRTPVYRDIYKLVKRDICEYKIKKGDDEKQFDMEQPMVSNKRHYMKLQARQQPEIFKTKLETTERPNVNHRGTEVSSSDGTKTSPSLRSDCELALNDDSYSDVSSSVFDDEGDDVIFSEFDEAFSRSSSEILEKCSENIEHKSQKGLPNRSRDTDTNMRNRVTSSINECKTCMSNDSTSDSVSLTDISPMGLRVTPGNHQH